MQMLAPRHIYTSHTHVCMCVSVYTFYVFVHEWKCRSRSMVLIDGLDNFFHFAFKQHLRFNLLSQSFWTIRTFCTHPCMAQKVWIHQSWHVRILHVLHVVYAAQKHVILYIGQKNCRDISQVIGRGSASTLRCMWGCLMGMHVCAENVSRIIGEVTSPLLCSLSHSHFLCLICI